MSLVVLPVVAAAGSSPGDSIPWGAMYVPNEARVGAGMSGCVKAYCGTRGAAVLLEDLAFALEHRVQLILTLGSVSPSTYLDDEGHLRLEAVDHELAPFAERAEDIRPYLEAGVVWEIHFMDEPQDLRGIRGSDRFPSPAVSAGACVGIDVSRVSQCQYERYR